MQQFMENIEELNKQFQKSTPEEIIKYFADKFKSKIIFASSMGAEDQVITHIISQISKNFKIFTLDTGRMFSETYNLIAETEKHYGIKINICFPDKKNIEDMVNTHGINLFYESIENRKLCCRVRKIKSLKIALKGMDAWICGLRQEQSITRFNTNIVEWDKENGLVKINPLCNWTEAQVWQYIRENKIPYNPLHDKGFPSIGCQPCTRAVAKGEDARSGRWWWETPDNKECGLHKK